MRDIRQYLHLYIGCQVEAIVHYQTTSRRVQGKLVGVDNGIPILRLKDINGIEWDNDYKTNEITLILRPLSSMTEEERNELRALQPAGEDMFWVKNLGIPAFYMLSKGFDLFGLIDSGLAIELKTEV